MSTKKQNTTALITQITTPSKTFIGIDFHKRYSVYHVLDEAGKDVAKGRIEHATPDEFGKLVKRWAGCRVAFEATMNCLRPCGVRFAIERDACALRVGTGFSSCSKCICQRRTS